MTPLARLLAGEWIPVGARRVVVLDGSVLILGDAADILPQIPVGAFDAVVMDPPYGIGEAAGKNASRGKLATAKDYGSDDWDNQPIPDDLMTLARSRGTWNIVFGGNYYRLPPSQCWLVWDKMNGRSDFADCELAWTNMDKATRMIRYMWNGMLRANNEPRGDHPTQKAVGVMKWAIEHLPDGSRTILDPFMGSGTTGVAAVTMGRKFVGIERNEAYFNAAVRRLNIARQQMDLFNDLPPTQEEITI